MRKVLFLIHDLGQGGAEKVLVNLVNHLDRSKFEISVTVLFGGGVNEQFLAKDICFKSIFPKQFPRNTKLTTLMSPEQLHKVCVKDTYDIEVAYLEGPSARVISGCKNVNTKLVSWIHAEQHTIGGLSHSFRNEQEARECYNRFNQIICVSRYVHDDFCKIMDFRKPCKVLYNTVESNKILEWSRQSENELLEDGKIRLIAVGTLKKSKGYMRLLSIIKKLCDERYPVHLYILGTGPLQFEMEKFIRKNELQNTVTMLGYQTNPYKYISKCDLFVCASYAEGFSTATTEALIVGTPVCTVEVSGMREMLGNNEYGIITDNKDEALYDAIERLLSNPKLLKHYKEKAIERGKMFSTKITVRKVEDFFESLMKKSDGIN